MAVGREGLRDWHRLFGLLLTDFFSGSPFVVEVERDLLGQLFERLQGEGFAMSFTMEDFQRQYAKEHFNKLTPAERREALESLPADQRREVLRSLPAEEQ